MSTQSSSWHRQPGEPNRWYDRFEAYRLLGSNRSLESAFRTITATSRRPGAAWRSAAERWKWQERAEAWDEIEREQLRAAEAQRRFDARQRRLKRIEELQTQAYEALIAANLPEIGQEQARELVGSLRNLFGAMLLAERLEYGDPTEIREGNTEFTADDLARAQAELERWTQKLNG